MLLSTQTLWPTENSAVATGWKPLIYALHQLFLFLLLF